MNSYEFDIAAVSGQAIYDNLVQFIRYEEGSATGGVTPWIRIKSITGNVMDYRMKPGRWMRLPEPVRGLVIINDSGATNLVANLALGFGMGGDDAQLGTFDLSNTTLAALESTDLNAATQDILRRPLAPNLIYKSRAALAGSTAELVLAAATNTAGVVVLDASIVTREAGVSICGTFIAKATAPASIFDGDPVLISGIHLDTAQQAQMARLAIPQLVPAGQALWFIAESSLTSHQNTHRYLRGRVL